MAIEYIIPEELTPVVNYVVQGVENAFAYKFFVVDSADLYVFVNGVEVSKNFYSVTGINDENGGTVTIDTNNQPLVVGDVVTLSRFTLPEQLTQFLRTGDFTSDAVNAEFNRLYALMQEQRRDFEALKSDSELTDSELQDQINANNTASISRDNVLEQKITDGDQALQVQISANKANIGILGNFYSAAKYVKNWVQGEVVTDPFQRYFYPNSSPSEKSYTWNAPSASAINPITLGASPIGDANWQVWDVTQDDIKEAEERLLGVSTEIYRGSNGKYAQVGETIPLGTTHIRVPIDGNPEDVKPTPKVSGVIESISSLSIVANSVTSFLRRSNKSFVDIEEYGVPVDGVSDSTTKWNELRAVVDLFSIPLFVPMNAVVVLDSGTLLPRAGVYGVSQMCSTIRVTTPVGADSNTIGLIYNDTVTYAQSYGRLENIRIEVDNDTTSPIILLNLNVVSRGAGMSNVTLHCGTGYCVGVDQFFYYKFDRVTFEGRYIQDDLINASNPLYGTAFKQLNSSEINNIEFNKCEFLYLEEVFESAGTFVGSNAIGLYNCSFEKLGKGLGSVAGWWVNFHEGYIEKLGLNETYDTNDPSLLTCGAGNVTFNKTLMNLSTLPANRDLFVALLNTVRVVDITGTLPASFTGKVIKQISYSTRGLLINENSPMFDDSKLPAYRRRQQEYVGGYGIDMVLPKMSTPLAGRNHLSLIALNQTGAFSLNSAVSAHIALPTSSKYTITVKGTVSHTRNDTGATESMTFYGTALIDTAVNTSQSLTFINVTNGAEFDSTWDEMFTIEYSGTESNGYRRYTLQFTTKTGRAYSRSVLVECDVNLYFRDGTDATISLTAIR